MVFRNSIVPKIKRIGSNQMNHISLVLQPFPLLPQRESIKPESFCNSTNLPSSCIKEQCACTHVLQVKLNSIVELVLVNDGKFQKFILKKKKILIDYFMKFRKIW